MLYRATSTFVDVIFPSESLVQPNVVGAIVKGFSTCVVEPGAGMTNVGPFEQSVNNITHVVSRKQKARGLHFDSEAFNLFTCQTQMVSSDSIGKEPSVVVQIGTYAIPLTKPCSVLIPKGGFVLYLL